ncbi:hypothetical protein ACUUL3_16235 [Thiovibrio sp. JS02]
MAGTDKRDIMDDLLKGSAEDAQDAIPLLENLIHRERQKAEARKREGAGTVSRQTKKRKKTSKKKTTHYISEEICEDLDDAQGKINTLIQRHLKSRVSKSKIVDQALKMILRDFEEKGERSPLIQEILKDIFKE